MILRKIKVDGGKKGDREKRKTKNQGKEVRILGTK